jgi:hypothetical protein
MWHMHTNLNTVPWTLTSTGRSPAEISRVDGPGYIPDDPGHCGMPVARGCRSMPGTGVVTGNSDRTEAGTARGRGPGTARGWPEGPRRVRAWRAPWQLPTSPWRWTSANLSLKLRNHRSTGSLRLTGSLSSLRFPIPGGSQHLCARHAPHAHSRHSHIRRGRPRQKSLQGKSNP